MTKKKKTIFTISRTMSMLEGQESSHLGLQGNWIIKSEIQQGREES